MADTGFSETTCCPFARPFIPLPFCRSLFSPASSCWNRLVGEPGAGACAHWGACFPWLHGSRPSKDYQPGSAMTAMPAKVFVRRPSMMAPWPNTTVYDAFRVYQPAGTDGPASDSPAFQTLFGGPSRRNGGYSWEALHPVFFCPGRLRSAPHPRLYCVLPASQTNRNS